MFANNHSLAIGGLLVSCFLVASLLILKWFNPPSPDDNIPLPNKNVSDFEIEPVQPFQVAPLNNYRNIVERPLFLTERRPPEEAPEETPISESPVGDEDLVLLGVVLTPDTNMALLQVDQRGQVARLRVGEKVNGWELQSVEANQVNLHNGEKELDLPLLRNSQKGSGGSRQSRTDRRRSRATQPQYEEDYLESDMPPYR
jgi:hypothetical protein